MKICLVGHSADFLRGKPTGGSEKQIGLLAKHMARRGHNVVFVETNCDDAEEIVDGVRIIGAWEKHRGIRGIRLLTYRIPSLMRVLSRVSADLYYTRSGSFTTRAVISAGKKTGAATVLGLASDRDLYSDAGKVLFAMRNKLTSQLIGRLAYQLFYVAALRKADWVVAQNRAQAFRCKELGLTHQIIPSMVELNADVSARGPKDSDVLWVGNIDSETRRSKGFYQLVTIIQQMTDVRFEIVGLLNSSALNWQLTILKQLRNVSLVGRLSHTDALGSIARTKLVINTSPAEGFSNVFLEAWTLGKPVISLHANPNGLLHEGGFGYCAGGDMRSMIDVIHYYLTHENERRKVGERGRAYIEITHVPDVVCQLYEGLFKRI